MRTIAQGILDLKTDYFDKQKQCELLSLEKDQDWEHETTRYYFADKSGIADNTGDLTIIEGIK